MAKKGKVISIMAGRAITIVLFVAFVIEVISGLVIAIQDVIAVQRECFAPFLVAATVNNLTDIMIARFIFNTARPVSLAPGLTYCLSGISNIVEGAISWLAYSLHHT